LQNKSFFSKKLYLFPNIFNFIGLDKASGIFWDLDTKLVQRYLGHSDVATTLRYYVDVFPEDLEEAAEMLAEK
jgi:integrase